jgi:hypothetical protein
VWQYADRAKAIVLKARKNEKMTEVGKLKAEIEALKAQLEAAATGGGGGGGGGGGMSEEEQLQVQQQLAERDAMINKTFEDAQKHAREAEELRAALVTQQQSIQAEMTRKTQEDRRGMVAGMLEADSDAWVRVLLTETRRDAQGNKDLLDEMNALEASRLALGTRVREQAAFISVLQHNLQKEVINYLQQVRRPPSRRAPHGPRRARRTRHVWGARRARGRAALPRVWTER